jgi:hypothetical protein
MTHINRKRSNTGTFSGNRFEKTGSWAPPWTVEGGA